MFVGSKEVEVLGGGDDGQSTATYSADKILVAVGGRPSWPDIPGAQLGISSDGFFQLDELPKKTVVVGAGYIAVEMAGILNSLGSDVTQIIRYDKVLRSFDTLISDKVTENVVNSGAKLVKNSQVVEVRNGDGKEFNDVDCVLWAIGRTPNTADLNLDLAGVETDARGYVKVDEFQNTSNPCVLSVGDDTGKWELTPVAIAAGRRLAHRLFDSGKETLKLDYFDIPGA